MIYPIYPLNCIYSRFKSAFLLALVIIKASFVCVAQSGDPANIVHFLSLFSIDGAPGVTTTIHSISGVRTNAASYGGLELDIDPYSAFPNIDSKEDIIGFIGVFWEVVDNKFILQCAAYQKRVQSEDHGDPVIIIKPNAKFHKHVMNYDGVLFVGDGKVIATALTAKLERSSGYGGHVIHQEEMHYFVKAGRIIEKKRFKNAICRIEIEDD